MEIFKLFGSIFVDNDNANRNIAETDSRASGLGQTFVKGAKLVGGFALAIGGAIAGSLAFALKDGIAGMMEMEEQTAQLDSVLKSTGGVAGVTRDQVLGLADALEKTTKFSAENIIEGQNLLLTFTKIGEDVFPRATQAMADMATGMGTDVAGQAIALGKALNDPVAGVAALSRVGVQFTEDQKKVIETMVNTGDIAGAQSVILAELETQFGGSAEAAGKTFAGQLEIAKNAVGGITESLAVQFMPVLQTMLQWVMDNLPAIQGFFQTTFDTIGFLITTFTGLFTGEIKSLESVFEYLSDELLGGSSNDFTTWLGEITYVLSQVIGYFEENFLPILKTVVDYIIENWPLIQEAVQVAFDAIIVVATRLWEFFKINVMPILQALWDLFIAMMPAIKIIAEAAFTQIVTVIKGLWYVIDKFILPILGVLAKMVAENIGSVQKVFEVSFKIIGDVINGVIDTIKSMIEWTGKAIDAVRNFFSAKNEAEGASAAETTTNAIQGGKSVPVTVPRGPRGLAAGGEVMTDGVVRVGEVGPEDLFLPQGAMVMPLSKSPASAPNVSIVITGNTLLGESDELADRLGGVVVTRLRELGVF